MACRILPYPPMGPARGRAIHALADRNTDLALPQRSRRRVAGIRPNQLRGVHGRLDRLHEQWADADCRWRGRQSTADWVASRARAACRGVFVARQDMKFRDILDGLANTIMCGEITTDLGDRDIRTIAAIQNGTMKSGTSPITVSTMGQISPTATADSGPTELTAELRRRWPRGQGRGYRWADAGRYGPSSTRFCPEPRTLPRWRFDSGGVGCAWRRPGQQSASGRNVTC